jgi:hypothetical protein
VSSGILHANGGSAGAFEALEVALSAARHDRSELHRTAERLVRLVPCTIIVVK